jgi:hypothetical protein
VAPHATVEVVVFIVVVVVPVTTGTIVMCDIVIVALAATG